MKTPEKINIEEFLTGLKAVSETIEFSKSVQIAKRLTVDRTTEASKATNIILMNSKFPEEAFVHAKRIYKIFNHTDSYLVKLMLQVTPPAPIDLENEFGTIADEEVDFLLAEFDASFDLESATIPYVLAKYQKREGASWKGMLMLYIKLLDSE